MKAHRAVATGAMAFAPRILGRFGVVLTLVFPVAACPQPTGAPPGAPPSARTDAGAQAAVDARASSQASSPGRPPWPNMATAAWGQRVLEQRAQALPPSQQAGRIEAVLDALHELNPGSESRAAELAVAAFQTVKSPQERGTACALLAVALVLDPTVEGYKDRLIDAAGLAAYAGTLDASDSIGQAARAAVSAATGAVEQARRLVEVVSTTPRLGPEPRLFLALTRKLEGERGDAMVEDLRAALAARPASVRARALLAEFWLDVGLYPEAEREATIAGGSAPWLDAIRGRALALAGKPAEGVALLQAAEARLDEGHRGDALYWLGRTLTQLDTPTERVESIASSLSTRAGFAKESAILTALLAQKAGDYGKARALVEPLVKGPPRLPVDVDASWLLADACAGLGDVTCVNRAGARAVSLDGDDARLHTTRAAAALVGKSDGVDAAQELVESHRASPFDPKLAAKVSEAVVPGGDEAAARVRAARRALLRKAPQLVDGALAKERKNNTCRVCRALDAWAATGLDAAKKATAALDGAGPALAVDDLVRTVDALGAAPTEASIKALDRLAGDTRDIVKRAIHRARADHQDPDARRRRDAGESPDGAAPGFGPPPGLLGQPGAPAAHGPHGGGR